MNRRAFLGVLAGTALTVGAGAGGTLAFLRQKQFGALPEGESLRRIMASPHYADGAFHNLVPHPVLSDDSSFAEALIRSLVEKRTGTEPSRPIPSLRPDLSTLNGIGDAIIWLGHSSFLIRLGGKNILIDPVFSDHASPVSFSTRAFAGATPCSARDMPDIDVLLISHDHWDHLDYPMSRLSGAESNRLSAASVPALISADGVSAGTSSVRQTGERASSTMRSASVSFHQPTTRDVL